MSVFLSLGSNLGNRKNNIVLAYKTICSWDQVQDGRLSRLYQSSPVMKTSDTVEQPDYINAVMQCTTSLTPEKLMEKCQRLEREFGEKPSQIDGPRYLDIDLLFFKKQVIQTETLTVPHPRWQQRLFVLFPLMDLTDIIEGQNLASLARAVKGQQICQIIKEGTL